MPLSLLVNKMILMVDWPSQAMSLKFWSIVLHQTGGVAQRQTWHSKLLSRSRVGSIFDSTFGAHMRCEQAWKHRRRWGFFTVRACNEFGSSICYSWHQGVRGKDAQTHRSLRHHLYSDIDDHGPMDVSWSVRSHGVPSWNRLRADDDQHHSWQVPLKIPDNSTKFFIFYFIYCRLFKKPTIVFLTNWSQVFDMRLAPNYEDL